MILYGPFLIILACADGVGNTDNTDLLITIIDQKTKPKAKILNIKAQIGTNKGYLTRK